jgi:hypothetical protein
MPAPLLAFSDSEIATIMQLSRPLLPVQRTAFLEMLAAKLNDRRELGDGQLHRIVPSCCARTCCLIRHRRELYA